MDIWSKAKRSEVMSRIKGRDTKPELIVRSLLHRAGVRFSLRRKDLPGRPDIVLPKYRAIVFVHGCFWHRHKGCKVASMPKSRKTFWQAKFKGNVARDKRNRRDLERLGWRVLVVWECAVMRDPRAVLDGLLEGLQIRPGFSYDAMPGKQVLMKVAEGKLQWNLKHAEGGPAGKHIYGA
jgi:DNA mismatch endonuclease (patch repair protein)